MERLKESLRKKLKRIGMDNVDIITVGYSYYSDEIPWYNYITNKQIGESQIFTATTRAQLRGGINTYMTPETSPSNPHWYYRAEVFDKNSGGLYKIRCGNRTMFPRYIIAPLNTMNPEILKLEGYDAIQEWEDEDLLKEYSQKRLREYIPIKEYEITDAKTAKYIRNTLQKLEEDYIKEHPNTSSSPKWAEITTNTDDWIEYTSAKLETIELKAKLGIYD